MQKPLRPVAPDSTLIELPAANHSVTNPVFRWRDFCMDQQGTERGIFPSMLPDKIKFTFQGKSVFPSDDPFYILRHRPPVPSQRVLQIPAELSAENITQGQYVYGLWHGVWQGPYVRLWLPFLLWNRNGGLWRVWRADKFFSLFFTFPLRIFYGGLLLFQYRFGITKIDQIIYSSSPYFQVQTLSFR